eukprot:scaffold12869_cov93-Isochrysis_galbana.AAC.3
MEGGGDKSSMLWGGTGQRNPLQNHAGTWWPEMYVGGGPETRGRHGSTRRMRKRGKERATEVGGVIGGFCV